MDRLTKRGAISQRDIEKLLVYSNENQFGPNNAYFKLQRYEDYEEQGLLRLFPCKVGDTVWCIFRNKIYEAIAQKITMVTGIDNYQLIKIEAEFDMIDPFYNDGRTKKLAIYGNYLEDVFLTKAEAEKKLAEMRCE